MSDVWFWLVAATLTAYAVLDGFDLGAAALHPFLARTERQRRDVYAAIGPVWDGNEVFLIAAGATTFLAFPVLYATVFSGLYLPLMVVLWLLIGRGISVEFRNHVASPVWRRLWDGLFFVSSALLVVAFGAALGNLVRGAPLDAEGRFFAPLWTDFDTHGPVGLLDRYTVLVAAFVFATVAMHGAAWLSAKTRGVLRDRSLRAAGRWWFAVAALAVLTTIETFRVQPRVPDRFAAMPAGLVIPALAVAALVLVRVAASKGRDGLAFAGSSAFVAAMLASAAFGIHPYVLPSNAPTGGLTAEAAAAGERGLRLALLWWIPGMLLACAWIGYVYVRVRGRVGTPPEAAHAEGPDRAPPPAA